MGYTVGKRNGSSLQTKIVVPVPVPKILPSVKVSSKNRFTMFYHTETQEAVKQKKVSGSEEIARDEDPDPVGSVSFFIGS